MTRRSQLLIGVWLILGSTSQSNADESADRSWFGSYGRVNISDDGGGSRGRGSHIVPWGPRLTEGNYLELDSGYAAFREDDVEVDVLVTLGIGDRFFHYTGQWETDIAIRQAYAEARNLVAPGSFLWIGSRMYRGDDIYLFDFWPMDILNTTGAGIGWRGPMSEYALHLGFNRLENEYQSQHVAVPDVEVKTADAVFLDRQRMIASAKAEKRYGGTGDALGVKIRLYGEVHRLPEGERAAEGSFTRTEPLPDDLGWLVGAQFGLWNFARRGHLNAWIRYATGLAAYGEFAVPSGLDEDRRAVDAREIRLAFSSNYETPAFGLLAGGYVRHFKDADEHDEDFDDRLETALSLRPMWFVGRYFTPGAEASIQLSRPNGLNPRSQRQATARVVQLALVPAFTLGPAPVGSYTRPQFRMIYAVSLLNDAALDYYAADDPRSSESTVHFVGVGAEWWFGRGGGY